MKNFSTFLAEAAASEDKLKHLEHAEDHPLNAGAEGYEHAVKTLHAVHQAMQGKPSDASISTKYDGSPSIVFGHHPTTGKFFVASKSAFNATPKLNYTPEDIDRNHGHAPGLVEKLKDALKHLPKVAPDKGIYQGDVMHSGSKDVKSKGDEYHFTPNTITYTAKKGSPEGRKIASSKFGVVVHTQYKGKDFDSMKATFNPDLKKFNDHPDVHMISPTVDPSGSHYDKKTTQQFEQHMADAEAAHAQLAKGGYDRAQPHADAMKTYINSTVRSGETPSVEGLKNHIATAAQKQIDKLKTASGKSTRQRALEMTHKAIDTAKKHVSALFNLHGSLQKAKNVLVHAMEPAVKGPFGTKIGDQDSKSEGSVVTINGRPTKLVDREEFSRANFARGDALKKQDTDKKAEEEKHGVLAFGRMNPPTTGHAKVAEKVMEVAKANSADHKIVLSASQDAKKNPLTADQKVRHALRAFPEGSHVVAADKDKPTILHQAAEMYKSGIKHLHIVAGSDRQQEMQALLDKYNGKKEKHGEYKFKSITVHSSGERDPDAEGDAGMSGTKMREHASNNDFKEFRKGVPAHVSDAHAKEMMKDVRKGMGLK
jgi:hypothetical protein